MNIKTIILAGGSGSRLWPLSRELYPKQLLKINNEYSLLESTFLRLLSLISSKDIITITNVKHTPNVKAQLKEISKQEPVIISEPLSKNTAPAIAAGVKFFNDNEAENDPVILVLPSDHLIVDTEKFLNTVKKAYKIAETGYIVTFGITPDAPETGYGYIDTVKNETLGQIVSESLKVSKFVEKPNIKTAEDYIQKGTFYWNSGIFMFKASTFIEELKKYAPAIHENLADINFDTNNLNIDYVTYDKMPNISVDYAVMEKSNKIALLPLESDWNDLGSWQAVYETSPKDENNNVLVGNVLNKGCKNSLIYSKSKLVAAIGLDDIVVIETDDAILACKKDKTQEVKNVFDDLKKINSELHMVHKTVFRPWGFYHVIEAGEGYLIKTIHVQPDQKLSIQIHNHRSEHWVVLSGKAKVVLEDKDYILESGQSIDIPLKAKHSLQNPFNEEVIVIEVQKGDLISEDDIIRIEDIYGRV